MSTLKTKLQSVSRSRPCLVCDGNHKCSRGSDSLILCGRRSGSQPGFVHLGPAKGETWHLYRTEDDPILMDRARSSIRPRLDAAGADCERVSIVDAIAIGEQSERLPILPTDLDLMEELARERRVKLLIVDPFMAYLDGELNAHKDQDVRRCLHRLKIVAEKTGATVVLVRHLNKLNGGPALYRGGGSIGISGAARSALVVGSNPANPQQLILALTKCNLCKMPSALTYSVYTADNGASRIGWGEETILTADEILGNPRRNQTVGGECADMIRNMLADGPKPAKDVKEALEANGYTVNAIREGKKAAQVETVRQGFGDSGSWLWQLKANEEETGGAQE